MSKPEFEFFPVADVDFTMCPGGDPRGPSGSSPRTLTAVLRPASCDTRPAPTRHLWVCRSMTSGKRSTSSKDPSPTSRWTGRSPPACTRAVPVCRTAHGEPTKASSPSRCATAPDPLSRGTWTRWRSRTPERRRLEGESVRQQRALTLDDLTAGAFN